jgi:hypothetical protein
MSYENSMTGDLKQGRQAMGSRDSAPFRREPVNPCKTRMRRSAGPPALPRQRRAEELEMFERFLAQRGPTRCPDLATTQKSPLPVLAWDKVKRKWVRPSATEREASQTIAVPQAEGSGHLSPKIRFGAPNSVESPPLPAFHCCAGEASGV